MVVVTGRPPMFLRSLLAGARVGGEALCANGAIVVDLATLDVLQAHAMPPPLCERSWTMQQPRARRPRCG